MVWKTKYIRPSRCLFFFFLQCDKVGSQDCVNQLGYKKKKKKPSKEKACSLSSEQNGGVTVHVLLHMCPMFPLFDWLLAPAVCSGFDSELCSVCLRESLYLRELTFRSARATLKITLMPWKKKDPFSIHKERRYYRVNQQKFWIKCMCMRSNNWFTSIISSNDDGLFTRLKAPIYVPLGW